MTNEQLHTLMLKAQITPRHLKDSLPCHPMTLYTYIRTGNPGRPLTAFTFEKLGKFLDSALNSKILPLPKGSTQKADKVARAYKHWDTNGNFDQWTN